MALAEIAGAAYIGTAAANVQAFASFTPTANALIVAIVGVGNGNGVTPTSLTITDTFGGTATGPWYTLASGLEASGGAAGVFCKDAGSSPGAGVVTATVLPSTVLNLGGIVRQFTGALTAAYQNAGAGKTALGTVDAVSITPIVTGGQVVGAFGAPVTGTVTANAATTLYGQTAGAGGDQFGAFEASSMGTANTAVSVGFTATKATCAIAAAGILPATASVYALVGSIGAASQGAASASVTPAWGTGENRTAGNLLVCWCQGNVLATLPGTPSGWNVAVQEAGTLCSSTVFWRVATGTDGAPTIAAVTSILWSAQLAEFTASAGVAPASPVDQTGKVATTTTPAVATCGSTDATTNELVVGGSAIHYTAAAAKTLTDTLNNGMTGSVTQLATSSANHYDNWYSTTATNGSADSDSFAFTATAISGDASVICSFLLPSGAVAALPFVSPRVNQAIVRAGFY